MNNKFVIGWLVCGAIGVAIGSMRQPNKTKKMEPFILLILVVFGVAMGPLSLIAAFQAEEDDK